MDPSSDLNDSSGSQLIRRKTSPSHISEHSKTLVNHLFEVQTLGFHPQKFYFHSRIKKILFAKLLRRKHGQMCPAGHFKTLTLIQRLKP